MSREKRQFTRITINLFTVLSLYQIETYRTGWLSNISMGGCFFPTDEELPVGEDCQIKITIGEGIETETINLSGKVIRKTSEGVGIRFDQDFSYQNQALEKIINQLL